LQKPAALQAQTTQAVVTGKADDAGHRQWMERNKQWQSALLWVESGAIAIPYQA